MKRFLLHAVIVAAPVILILLGWELLMRNAPHELRFKRNVIMKECTQKGTILVLGSSHSFYGVKTDSIPNAYNLAFVSQTYEYDRFIFETFLKTSHDLKCVMVPISIFSFFEALDDLEQWKEGAYIKYWGYPAKNFTDKFFILDNIPQQLKQYKRIKKRVKRRGLHAAFRMSPTGWGTNQAIYPRGELFEKVSEGSAKRHCAVDLNKTQAFDELKALVRLAAKNKVKVILFTPPAHVLYWKHLRAEQEKKMRELIAQLEKEPGVYYLDLLRSKKFEDKDYGDGDHLSPQGAEKLAKMLYEHYERIARN